MQQTEEKQKQDLQQNPQPQVQDGQHGQYHQMQQQQQQQQHTQQQHMQQQHDRPLEQPTAHMQPLQQDTPAAAASVHGQSLLSQVQSVARDCNRSGSTPPESTQLKTHDAHKAQHLHQSSNRKTDTKSTVLPPSRPMAEFLATTAGRHGEDSFRVLCQVHLSI